MSKPRPHVTVYTVYQLATKFMMYELIEVPVPCEKVTSESMTHTTWKHKWLYADGNRQQLSHSAKWATVSEQGWTETSYVPSGRTAVVTAKRVRVQRVTVRWGSRSRLSKGLQSNNEKERTGTLLCTQGIYISEYNFLFSNDAAESQSTSTKDTTCIANDQFQVCTAAMNPFSTQPTRLCGQKDTCRREYRETLLTKMQTSWSEAQGKSTEKKKNPSRKQVRMYFSKRQLPSTILRSGYFIFTRVLQWLENKTLYVYMQLPNNLTITSKRWELEAKKGELLTAEWDNLHFNTTCTCSNRHGYA